jgi:hypothetical protein
MGTIHVMWGGPGWYAARIERGERTYYLVSGSDVSFGVGPTVHFVSKDEIFERWSGYDVAVY